MVPDPAPGVPRGNGAPPGMDDETIARFTHHGKLPLLAMVGLDPGTELELDARFVGCDVERLRQIRRAHDEVLDATAAELLEDGAFRRVVAALPFRSGEVVAVIGDSVTADSLSWAHLLAAVLRRADRTDVEIVNLAVSGITTTEAIAMFGLIARTAPAWVVQLLGTNDARRQGATAQVRTVSAEETRRNLRALRELVTHETRARHVVITPPPFRQELFDAFTPADSEVRWRREDVREVEAIIRSSVEDAVDLGAALPGDLPDEFWLPDGLHPSLLGHRLILAAVVAALARPAPGRAASPDP